MAYRKGETDQERRVREADQLYNWLVEEWRGQWEDFPHPQMSITLDQAKAYTRRRYGSPLFAAGLMANLVQRRKLYKIPNGLGSYWTTDGTPGCPEAVAWREEQERKEAAAGSQGGGKE